MSEDVKVKIEGEETRLSKFLEKKCTSEELVEFNLDRIVDSFEDVKSWQKIMIPVKEGDQNIQYYEMEKVE